MKKITIVILLIIIAIALYRFGSSEKRATDPAREAKCKEFLAVAIFPDGAAAEAFLERCLAGEPVLPEDQELE